MAHSTRVAYWFGGGSVVPPFDGIPASVITGNSGYRSRTQGVDQFEPLMRLERIFNMK